MKAQTEGFIHSFFLRHTDLDALRGPIVQVGELLIKAFQNGNKLLLCGNGGSCADCDHIAGELLKGFLLKRPLDSSLRDAMTASYGERGAEISSKLQQGLPAISLCTHSAAISAFANDVDADLVYAQQVLAYGRPGDVLLAISTSGNAGNVAAAVMAANVMGMVTVGLTGKGGGKLAELAQYTIMSPLKETYQIQEDHLSTYHLLCAIIELEIFDT